MAEYCIALFSSAGFDFGAFGKAMPVNLEECHGCHTCEAVCDEDACHVEEDE